MHSDHSSSRNIELINLAGKIALITGGSNDIGGTICRTLSKAGATIVIHYYKNRAKAEKTCRDITSAGGVAITCGADISDKDSADALFKFIKDEFGRLDILVNNAHLQVTRNFFFASPSPEINSGSGLRLTNGSAFFASLNDIACVERSEKSAAPVVTWEEHQEQINVMVRGTFYCSQQAAPLMAGHGGGSIINILTSLIDHPVKGYSSYVTAASALVGFTRNLAVEAGDKGIRVNMIAPGFVLTGHTPHAPAPVQEAIKKATPLGRLATPEDIAKAVLFFASDLSGFITGSHLVVDGGYSLSGRP